ELLREAERVFSPSKFLAAMYNKEHAGVGVRHMRHGVSYSNIRKNVRKYQKADRLTFFYGGSLTWHKGIHILVDAFRQVRGEAELKIYGSGDFEKVVRNLAIYDKRIKFCGVFSAEQLGGILSQVDAIILPSIWYENSPIMLLEALASDVPAIVTDLGGMAEAVKDGVTGRTFRLGDAAHLSEILQEIVDDPRLLNDYKENIRGNFVPSVEQEALAYQKEYQAICRNKPL
ncbi:MAG: glycosyltransferase, partial [Acidobacteriota bacterium]|nr:glycosyltransferase [Acidobacteriota bacterium]